MADVSLNRGLQVEERIAPSGQDLAKNQLALQPAFPDVPKRIEVRRALVESVGSQFEMASPGSDRRNLFQDLMRGVPIQKALAEYPGLDLGSNPVRTRELLDAYVQDRRLYEGRVARSNLKPFEVALQRSVVVSVRDADSIQGASARIGAALAQASLFNGIQQERIDTEKARINLQLKTLGATLEKMSQDGQRDTDAYRQASKDYSDALAKVIRGGAVRVSAAKSIAADSLGEDWNALDSSGRKLGPEDAAKVRGHLETFLQDGGVIGQVRPAQGPLFAGWERDSDVLLMPEHEARIALKADPTHNSAFLEARAAGGTIQPYYDFLKARHQAELDMPLSETPVYKGEETIGGAASIGLVSMRPMSLWGAEADKAALRESKEEALEAEILPFEVDSVRRMDHVPVIDAEVCSGGLDTRSPRSVESGHHGGLESVAKEPESGKETPESGSPLQMNPGGLAGSKPLVVTSSHLDARMMEEDLRKQQAQLSRRMAVSAGFATLSGGLEAIRIGSALAANPDGGAANAFMSTSGLALNTANQAVQGYWNSSDQRKRAMEEATQQKVRRQGELANEFRTKTLGAVAQLKEIGGDPQVVKLLHSAEIEAREKNATRLSVAWNVYQTEHSTEHYRELFTQLTATSDKKMIKMGERGLEDLETIERRNGRYTTTDFNTFAQPGILGQPSVRDAFDRLRLVTSSGTNFNARGEMLALERNYMDGLRIRFEQNAIMQDPAMKRDFHRAMLAQPGVTAQYAGDSTEYRIDIPSRKDPVRFLGKDLDDMLSSKWKVEHSLREANVRLADSDPLLAASFQKHGLDATSALEGTYTRQSLPSTNLQRISDSIRDYAEKNAFAVSSGKPGTDIIPKGWDVVDEEKHIGVMDLGHGMYAANLMGYDLKGNRQDGRLLFFAKNQETSELELVGNVKLDARQHFNSSNLATTIREKVESDWTTSILQNESVRTGISIQSLPQTSFTAANVTAQAKVRDHLRCLRDSDLMAEMARGLNFVDTRSRQNAMARTPDAFSPFIFPKRAHLSNPNVQARIAESFDPALAEARQDLMLGIRQRSDLSGIFNIPGRADSFHEEREGRRDFDQFRNAFDSPRVRDRVKSGVFEDPLRNDSGPSRTHVVLPI